MSNLPFFTDRRYSYGKEKEYKLTRKDGTTEIVQIEKLGIEREGTRINGATLNPIVQSLNELQGLSAAMLDMRKNFIAEAIAQTTRNNAALTGVNANIVIETFLNLNDVQLVHGTFDSPSGKIYLP